MIIENINKLEKLGFYKEYDTSMSITLILHPKYKPQNSTNRYEIYYSFSKNLTNLKYIFSFYIEQKTLFQTNDIDELIKFIKQYLK